MNKKRRQELRKLKFKKRLKNLNIRWEDRLSHLSFIDSGKPCSCFLCRAEKYRDNRQDKHKNKYETEN